MYLLDTNILRYFGKEHPILQLYLQKVPWFEIALPSIVVAEALRGWCDFALKAEPSKAPLAHRLLLEMQEFLAGFNVVVFDERCVSEMEAFRRKFKKRKRYADMMIEAIAKSGNHIVVTRNKKDFEKFLPKNQLANWIDEEPT
ncbi:MAG: type II toxin-antitoxin system VapC family toxin [bacterium]|nr:type II toxin-antitoxin system VapC family toxin [bacterium]